MTMWLAVDRMVTWPPDSQTTVCRSTLVLEDNCHPLDFKKTAGKKDSRANTLKLLVCRDAQILS